jgi:hypothetical protein
MEIWNCFEQRGAAWGIKTRGEWRVEVRWEGILKRGLV